MRRAQVVAHGRPLLEQSTRLAGKPDIFSKLQLHQLLITRNRNVGVARRRIVSVADLENAARGAMHTVMLMALTRVTPVSDISPAVRCAQHLHAAEPWIVEQQEIVRMNSYIA